MKKVDLVNVAPIDVTEAPKMVLPMPEPVKIPESLSRKGEPDKIWIYRMADGSAYGAVARWNPAGARKEIRPIVWNGSEFVASGFSNDRPLYNSDLLSASPMAPVLVVEGEKAADTAAAYVPEGWVVVTWQGGANAWSYTDWSLLTGRSVVIWPDNDTAGMHAANAIQERLMGMGAPSSVVSLGTAFPDGWDLGDELPEKFKPAQITALLRRELKRVAVPMAVMEGGATPTMPVPMLGGNDPDEDASREWRPLGYDRQRYFLMTDGNQQVHDYDGPSLMSEKTCMTIYGDREYWAEKQGTSKRPDWVMTGVEIMQRCRDAGVYDPKRIRGRGVWIDKAEDKVDRVILNTGGQLQVLRPEKPIKNVSFVRLRSKWIYEKSRNLIVDVNDYVEQSSDDEGRLIREMCGQLRWSAPIYGDLLAGWIATAIVCGGLDWRTHAWIAGNAGSGKSTIIKTIIDACIGGIAIYPQGNTTEAGIRQMLRSDAVPVVFDESETDKFAEQRRQAVLGLMRLASTDGRGTIMKGSASHMAHEFSIRSSFLMSSTGVGLKQAADLTRTAVLTMRPIESYALSERAAVEAQFNRILDIHAMMDPNLPQKLLARQVSNLFMLRQNIVTFKNSAAKVLNSPRLGDQIGTLLAGSYSLYNRNAISDKACERYIAKMDLQEFMTVKAEREDLALMHHICGSMVRVDTAHGMQERALGELMHIVFTGSGEGDVNPKVAEETLSRYGLRPERINKGSIPARGIWVGNAVPALNRLMQTSDYFEGWHGVLSRHPYAEKSNGTLRFGGVVSRALYMPRQEWPVNE